MQGTSRYVVTEGDLRRYVGTCLTVTLMATTRLRKTFHYPADDSEDDDEPLDLDEEGRPFSFTSVY